MARRLRFITITVGLAAFLAGGRCLIGQGAGGRRGRGGGFNAPATANKSAARFRKRRKRRRTTRRHQRRLPLAGCSSGIPILSGSKDVACATCHHPQFGYAENRDLSIGVNGIGLGDGRRFAPGNTIPLVKRNSQTILNVAFNGIDASGSYEPAAAPMFWDMRVRSLETQALEPIKALEEMRGRAYPEDKAVATVVARLNGNAEYRRLFADAFGENASRDERHAWQGARRVPAYSHSRAVAVRSLHARRHDRDDAASGRRHAPVRAHRLRQLPQRPDVLRLQAARPRRAGQSQARRRPIAGSDNSNAFRTASLRNLAYTAPYMHSGVFRAARRRHRLLRRRHGQAGECAESERDPRTARPIGASPARREQRAMLTRYSPSWTRSTTTRSTRPSRIACRAACHQAE